MIFGGILAGGVGSRMNLDSMPKQFLPLGSKPIFLHAVEKFALCAEFDALYIGAHKDWVDFVRDTVEATHFSIPVHVVCGGSDRNNTIMSIVDGIEHDYGSREEDVLITHDSVRPFVKLSTIKANIHCVRLYGACDTVVPATDTIVHSGDGEIIDEIPSRFEMYQGQTPQSFRIALFKQHFSALDVESKRTLTDACKILTMGGYPVHLVEGDTTNIKLTTVMDYKMAQAMLECGVG